MSELRERYERDEAAMVAAEVAFVRCPSWRWRRKERLRDVRTDARLRALDSQRALTASMDLPEATAWLKAQYEKRGA